MPDYDVIDVSADSNGVEPKLSITIRILGDSNSSEGHDYFEHPSVSFSSADKPTIDYTGPHGILKEEKSNNPNTERYTIILDLSYDAIGRIEEIREGDDLEVSISMPYGDFKAVHFDTTVSASDWEKILERMKYHGVRPMMLDLDVELPNDAHDLLTSAFAKIKKAEQHHDSGDYSGAMTQCRRALEDINKLHGEIDLEDHIGANKWGKIDDLILSESSFKGFTALLSHSEEFTESEPTLRRDSEMAVNITKSIIKFVSEAV